MTRRTDAILKLELGWFCSVLSLIK